MSLKLMSSALLLMVVQTGFGQIPGTMTYQGVLKDASGSPVPDGSHNLTFRIYDSENGDSPLWSEGQLVLVMNGIFNVILGEITPLSLSFDRPYWLGVQVGTEPELTPRVQFTGVAYSFKSETSDTANTTTGSVGGDLSGPFLNPTVVGIRGNPVAASMPEDGQVLKWHAANGEWRPSVDARSRLWTETGDDVYRETGRMGIGTSGPDALVDIVPDSNSGATDVLMLIESGNNTKRFKMHRRSGVRDFIQMRKSGISVASIDGSADIQARSLRLTEGGITAGGLSSITTSSSGTFSTVTTTRDYQTNISSPGRLFRNSLPLAYGHIAQNGDIVTGYGISEATKQGTGIYRIELQNNFELNPVVIANGVGATPDDEIFVTRGTSNRTISITIVNGQGQIKDSTFGFVVFGTPNP